LIEQFVRLVSRSREVVDDLFVRVDWMAL